MSSSVALILVSVLAYGLVQAIPLPSTNPCQDVMRMLQNGQNTQEIRENLLKSASARGSYKPSYGSGNNYYNNDDSYGDKYYPDSYSGNDNSYSGDYYNDKDDYYSGNNDDYYGDSDYYSGNGDDYYSGKDDYYSGDNSAYYSGDNSYSTYGSGNNYYPDTSNYYSGNNNYYSGKSKGKKGKKPQYTCSGNSCRKNKAKGKAGKKNEDGSRLVEEFLRMTGLGQEQSGTASTVLQQCSQLPGAPTFGDFLQSLRNAVAPQ